MRVCGCSDAAAYSQSTTHCGTTVRRTAATSMLRPRQSVTALDAVKDNEDLVASLLPVGDGLLVAVKR